MVRASNRYLEGHLLDSDNIQLTTIAIYFLIKLIINRWAWALVPQGWWSREMHSREGGIHGNPEAAITHLGTVTLKDSAEYLPNHNVTLTPTLWRADQTKIAKLLSERAWEMSLANDSKQQTACRGGPRVSGCPECQSGPGPCEGPGPPRALCGPREWADAYRRHKLSLRTPKASKGCRRALLRD